MTRELTCELCGNTFECCAPGACWCSGIKLNSRQRNTLSLLAGDCVCRECLEKMSSIR